MTSRMGRFARGLFYLLQIDDLRALARAFAEDDVGWSAQVQHDAEQPVFHKLLDGDEATVWLICWMPGPRTGLHDHDGSAGAVHVVAGAVRERRVVEGGAPGSRLVTAGEGFLFGPDAIHGVRHAGRSPAVTIHAYSPPLRGMGAYQRRSRRHPAGASGCRRTSSSACPPTCRRSGACPGRLIWDRLHLVRRRLRTGMSMGLAFAA